MSCKGKCKDDEKCKWRKSKPDAHGSIREWCGCGETEPDYCHLVFYTPGRGAGGGDPEVFCAGDCKKEKKCKLKEKFIGDGATGKVYELTCSCK